MTTTEPVQDGAIELITIRKDVYEDMLERIRYLEEIEFMWESCSK